MICFRKNSIIPFCFNVCFFCSEKIGSTLISASSVVSSCGPSFIDSSTISTSLSSKINESQPSEISLITSSSASRTAVSSEFSSESSESSTLDYESLLLKLNLRTHFWTLVLWSQFSCKIKIAILESFKISKFSLKKYYI